MPARNDASLAAAELALFVEQAALSTGGSVNPLASSSFFCCPRSRFAAAVPGRPGLICHRGPASRAWGLRAGGNCNGVHCWWARSSPLHRNTSHPSLFLPRWIAIIFSFSGCLQAPSTRWQRLVTGMCRPKRSTRVRGAGGRAAAWHYLWVVVAACRQSCWQSCFELLAGAGTPACASVGPIASIVFQLLYAGAGTRAESVSALPASAFRRCLHGLLHDLTPSCCPALQYASSFAACSAA